MKYTEKPDRYAKKPGEYKVYFEEKVVCYKWVVVEADSMDEAETKVANSIIDQWRAKLDTSYPVDKDVYVHSSELIYENP